ncbi:MAG TPA: DNA polymerase III subunit gamma/tau [Bacilli bacterium]|nr:DNA polymerase III subunit gamma/tau [Bacilli bacterium]
MAYKALYRTYRPQTFEEVAGQKVIIQTLKNALAKGKIAHAYLFSGPRGTGKTTMAKLLAKALNCEEGIGRQCNQCSNCLAVIDGSHPDVIEIDAASNNGVDNVRDLVENVKYSPIKGRYKVYIIDEVHMMSASAFNALLKTLEEPPSHVIFILATTEPHKVLPTIVSRCQRFDFTKVSDKDIRERLIHILDEEKVSFEPRALDLLIELADGGVRDALSMLDQILSYAGDKLVEKDILDVFGLANNHEKVQLIKQITQHQLPGVIEKLDYFQKLGIDLRRLNNDLLSIVKDALVYCKTQEPDLLKELTESEAKDIVSRSNADDLLKILDAFIKTDNDFRYVNNVRSLFEVSVIEMTVGPQKELSSTNENVNADHGVTPKKKLTPEEIKSVISPVDDEIELEPTEAEINLTPAEEEKKEPTPISAHELHENKPLIRKQILEENKPVSASNHDSSLQPIYETGDVISMDENMLINTMCIGDRDEKLALIEKWDELKNFFSDFELGRYAALLKDGQPYVLTKDVLILNYLYANRAKKVNIKQNQNALSTLVSKLINRKVVVYGVYDKERAQAQKKFMELSQLGRLPKAKNIIIKIKGVND